MFMSVSAMHMVGAVVDHVSSSGIFPPLLDLLVSGLVLQEASGVEFRRWLTQQEAADVLTFTIKDMGGSASKGVSSRGKTTPATAAATLQYGSTGGTSTDRV